MALIPSELTEDDRSPPASGGSRQTRRMKMDAGTYCLFFFLRFNLYELASQTACADHCEQKEADGLPPVMKCVVIQTGALGGQEK